MMDKKKVYMKPRMELVTFSLSRQCVICASTKQLKIRDNAAIEDEDEVW